MDEEQEQHTELARLRRSLRDCSNPIEMERNKFVKSFRLSKAAFLFILQILNSKLRTPSLVTSVPTIIKLAATLRFCAQGSSQLSEGNEHQFGLAESTASVVLKEVFNALEQTICKTFINFSFSEAEIDEAKLAFYNRSGFPNVIGCIDGTHIKIVAPRKELQHLYYNRKGFYSINAMVVCDHKMKIRYLNAKYSGASHDSMVFRMSALTNYLEAEQNAGRNKYWLLGDAGYPLKPYLMTPFRNAEEGSLESTYNKLHASARCIVERTIGVLKNRLRCLLGARALHYTPAKATQIINVCAALHNICINYNVEEKQDDGDVDPEDDQTSDDEPLPISIRNEAEVLRRRIMLSFI